MSETRTAAGAATNSLATGARERMRRATSSLHAQVDAGMPLSRPAPTLADYGQHLRILDDWLATLQCALPALALIGAERQALAVELQLTERLLDSAAAARPRPWTAPSPALDALRALGRGCNGWAAAWGGSYVIEGSHLGGQVLYRRLAPALAPHPLHYLRGSGEPGPRWRGFLLALAAQPWDEAALQTASDAAVQSFQLLLARLRATLPATSA